MNANNQKLRNDMQTIYRKGEYSHQAIYAKKSGLLTFKVKQLIWTTSDQQPVIIQLDSVIDKKKNYNQKKDTEMLLIATKDYPAGHIFSFSGGS